MSRLWGLILPIGRPLAALLVCCGGLGDGRIVQPGRGGLEQRRWSATPASSDVSAYAPERAVGFDRDPLERAGAFALQASVAAAPPEPVTAVDDGERQPARLWEFRSASPTTGAAAAAPGGLVYVTSVEGYVHALDADGNLRWSYGLIGMPIGAPAVDAAGSVYVATSERRSYALSADGALRAMRWLPSRVATALLWAAPGWVYHVGRDQNLYAASASGGADEQRFLGRGVTAELGRLGEDFVALGTTAAEAEVYRGGSLVARIELPSLLLQPLFGGGERWFALTAVGLSAYDARTHAALWSFAARRAALSADERTLLVESDGELCWLSPQTGQRYARARLPSDVSAAPAVTDSGVALVPLVSGHLFVVEPNSGRSARLSVAPAPAWSPVWDARAQRAVIAAGNTVAAFDLSGWPPPAGAAGPGADPRAHGAQLTLPVPSEAAPVASTPRGGA
jgi:hypothetical protein